jgi:hypothetical protein
MFAMARKPNAFVLPLMAIVIFVVLLSTYVGGYLGLGTFIDTRYTRGPGPIGIERNYVQAWQPHVFRPAASVESLLRGCDVILSYSYIPPKKGVAGQ